MMNRKKMFLRCIFDFAYKGFILASIALAYWFELFIVFPVVHPSISLGYVFHVLVATFLFTNTTLNYVYLVRTDTVDRGAVGSARADTKAGSLCRVCDVFMAQRLWHCVVCNTRVLRQDHHRQFGGSCVGYKNYRYFFHLLVCFVFSTVYMLMLNTRLLTATVLVWFSLCYALNLLAAVISLVLFRQHGFSIVTGMVKCATHAVPNLASVKMNLAQALGSRWYLTWISPMIYSELPTIGLIAECWSYDSD